MQPDHTGRALSVELSLIQASYVVRTTSVLRPGVQTTEYLLQVQASLAKSGISPPRPNVPYCLHCTAETSWGPTDLFLPSFLCPPSLLFSSFLFLFLFLSSIFIEPLLRPKPCARCWEPSRKITRTSPCLCVTCTWSNRVAINT